MYKTPLPIDLRVGAALYFWRTFDGLTQTEIARRANLIRTHYCASENSRRSVGTKNFLRLAGALNVSPYMLALTMEALG
jgi:transcriptional regulator with XRE-family HTH domain